LVNDKDIDEILKRASVDPGAVGPSTLARIGQSIESSMQPVRPLPPTWLLASALSLLCFLVAIAGATFSGFHGIERMNALQLAGIFPTLIVFVSLAAVCCVAEIIPGSRRIIPPRTLLAAGCGAMLAIFAVVFRNYGVDKFLPAGILCLAVGLLYAVPTGLLSWVLLRRGFTVDRVAAGLAGGTLAGLAGLCMLELHCRKLEAPHLMVWHTAVVLLSALLGTAIGYAVRSPASGSSSTAIVR
jgi:hypothetical protein